MQDSHVLVLMVSKITKPNITCGRCSIHAGCMSLTIMIARGAAGLDDYKQLDMFEIPQKYACGPQAYMAPTMVASCHKREIVEKIDKARHKQGFIQRDMQVAVSKHGKT